MLASGRMNAYVTIKGPPSSADGYGEVSSDPVDFVAVVSTWGEMRAVSGDERFYAGKVSEQTSHLFRMRYRSGIAPKQIVVWDDQGTERVLDVESVLNDGGRRELVLSLVEHGN